VDNSNALAVAQESGGGQAIQGGQVWERIYYERICDSFADSVGTPGAFVLASGHFFGRHRFPANILGRVLRNSLVSCNSGKV
jgi:hypothetical protein